MKNDINRRSFFKKSAILGAAITGSSLAAEPFGKKLSAQDKTDIAVIKGNDAYSNTIKAVEMIGGIGNFVSSGTKVGLVINSPWRRPGSFTNPEVALAVLKMCVDAGAGEIVSLESVKSSYWSRTDMSKKYEEEIKHITQAGNNFTNVKINNGQLLKEADVQRKMIDCDVLINVPVIKDHSGSRFTGILKNLMGAASSPTCRRMHGEIQGNNWYSDTESLSQSIVDLNKIRKPDLCIADAMELLLTNGPAGPGQLATPKTVVAGSDAVAVDSYCAKFVGRTGSQVLMIKKAHEQGLGEIDLNKLNIKETSI